MEPKCYHVSGANVAIQTASVGTQCMDIGPIGANQAANTTNSNVSDELTLAKSKAQLNSGNSYNINIVPMQIGGVQYHQNRRSKYPQQMQSEYQ